jgi:hypothetical protein
MERKVKEEIEELIGGVCSIFLFHSNFSPFSFQVEIKDKATLTLRVSEILQKKLRKYVCSVVEKSVDEKNGKLVLKK